MLESKRKSKYTAVGEILSQAEREFLSTGKMQWKSGKKQFLSGIRKKVKTLPNITESFISDITLLNNFANKEKLNPAHLEGQEDYCLRVALANIITNLPTDLKIKYGKAMAGIGKTERAWKSVNKRRKRASEKNLKEIAHLLKEDYNKTLIAMGIKDEIGWLERNKKARKIFLKIESEPSVKKSDLWNLGIDRRYIGKMVKQMISRQLIVANEEEMYNMTEKGKFLVPWFKRSGD